MKPNDFVIATEPVNGIVRNSVGIINSVSETSAQVYFVGKNEVVIAPFDSLDVIDVDQTGDDHPSKICNVCHIFKPTTEFEKNQKSISGKIRRRPSCDVCRIEIDGKKMSASEKRRMNAFRPPAKTVFICPICDKRSIVKITAEVRADHDHDTGVGRDWICDSCNTGLGRFKDNIAILEVAIEYLKKFNTTNSSQPHQSRLFEDTSD